MISWIVWIEGWLYSMQGIIQSNARSLTHTHEQIRAYFNITRFQFNRKFINILEFVISERGKKNYEWDEKKKRASAQTHQTKSNVNNKTNQLLSTKCFLFSSVDCLARRCIYSGQSVCRRSLCVCVCVLVIYHF